MRLRLPVVWFILAAAPSAYGIEVRIDRSLIPPDTPPKVREAIEQLYSPVQSVQLQSVRALAAMREEAAIAAPFLVTLLWGKTEIHRASAEALIAIGKPAVEPVVLALQVAENRYIIGNLLHILERLRDERATEALAVRYAKTEDHRARNILAGLGAPAVDRLLAMLVSPNPVWRAAAAKSLELSPTQRTCEALARAAGDEDPEVRGAVLATLSHLARQSGGAVRPSEELVKQALRDKEGGARRGALAVLAALTLSGQEDHLPALIEGFRDRDRGVQLTALEAISSLAAQGRLKGHAEILERQAGPALLEAFKDQDPAVRGKAVEVAALLERKDLLPALAELLKDENGQVRARAVYSLGKLEAKEHAAAVAAALKDGDDAVRKAAAETLGELHATEAREALKAAAEDHEDDVAAAAKKALAQLDSALPAPRAPPILGKTAPVPANRGREPASQAASYGHMAHHPPLPPAPPVRPRDPPAPKPITPPPASSAPKTGEPAKAAVNAEKQGFLLLLGNVKQREAAAQKALKLPDKGLAWICEALGSEHGPTRCSAVFLLGRLKLGAAADRLLPLLGDRERGVNEEVLRTLAALKGEAAAVASLSEALKKPETRGDALFALGQLGDPAGADALASVLKDSEWRMRRLAVENLGRLKAVPQLGQALRDSHWLIRRTAAEMLGESGSRAAAPALIEALADEHWYVRSTAHAGLVKLSGRPLSSDPAAWRNWWELEGKTK